MKKEEKEQLLNQVTVDQVVVNRVYHNSLGKGLNKLMKVALHRTKDQKARYEIEADLYRKLIQFRAVIDKQIEELDEKLSEQKERVWFPADKEYIGFEEIDGEPHAVLKPIKTTTEWRLALKASEERNNRK